MVRAPCCEKMGLKKGPWTREEDQILVDHITLYGHGNWRALPKQAGLLRCGKSCRLRWTNYLRPDIKRGNFSRDEEDLIINLHALLGNRWSAIAARLPGRTDNEIKNVWHTHLKKRVKHLEVMTPQSSKKNPPNNKKNPKFEENNNMTDHDDREEQDNGHNNDDDEEGERESKENSTSEFFYIDHLDQNSPQHSLSSSSSSIVTSASTNSSDDRCNMDGVDKILDNFVELDEDFWVEVFSGETSNLTAAAAAAGYDQDTKVVQCQNSPWTALPLYANELSSGFWGCNNISNLHDGMDFWYDVFTGAAELPKLPEFL